MFSQISAMLLVAAGSSYLPSVERSASPYDSSVRGPRKSMIFGESGGIERFQLAERVLCASIAERERKLLKLFSIQLLACSIAEHEMAKYVPMELLSSLSGKLCGHSDISFAKRGDTMYTQKRCNKRSTPYSQEEMARQEKFKAVSASTRARMKDPGKVMTDMEAFRAQKKYKTFYRFVFNLEWEAYEA